MIFKVIYNPEVYNDLQQAVHWYNKQQKGLGRRFFLNAKKHFHSLKKDALQYAIRYDHIHCMPIKKFPYMIHYSIDIDKQIVKVEAVFNTARNPKIWNKRTSL